MLSSPTSQHFVHRSMFPTKWYHRHEHSVHSLFRCEGSDVDILPAVGSSGRLCSTTFSHYIACSLTNPMHYRMDCQIVPSGSLR